MSEVTIHLICGFIGFGKTTYAKKLSARNGAVRLTPDEWMHRLYGPNPDNFDEKMKAVDSLIWSMTEEFVRSGRSVILDYGFWTKKVREEVTEKALSLTNRVMWHKLECPMAVAKTRVLSRSKEDKESLFIDENCFNEKVGLYEPVSADETYFKQTGVDLFVCHDAFVQSDT
ncbi:MAG: AAA family ATPase [Alphaproteobacteria bacterium]|nr:AAA family ATPase [Alphaproteobacteria bacterium]